jgi:hypothetical protein
VAGGQDLAAGRIWGNFECSDLGNPDTPGAVCSGSGHFVFENCDE